MKGQDTLFSHKSDEHGTPQDLYDKLNEIYHFELDPCCTVENQKAPYGCGIDVKEDVFMGGAIHIAADGLAADWSNSRVFVNPPYSNTKIWVEKSIYEVMHNDCPLVVMLLPSRTGMKWFTQLVLPYYKKLIFIQGRLKFEGQENSAPFDSIIVVFTKDNHDHDIEVWSNRP